jgi:predicted enzyme related to lactoylglutathione lyase
VSTDAEKAKKFYVAVMGWDYEDLDMGNGMSYTMLKSEGENVAGLGPMPPDMVSQGIPSLWNSYVSVDNVDAMVNKATSLGGTVIMEAMDVFDSGRMVMLQDPSGATLGLWQAQNHIGAGLVNTPGAMTWNELATRDTAAAQKFLEGLFGWEFVKDEASGYMSIKNKGRYNGGIMELSEEWGDVPPNWAVYFSVADIDDTVAKVKANGGSTMTDIMEAANVGRFAVIADPTGGVCTLMQSTAPQPWEE